MNLETIKVAFLRVLTICAREKTYRTYKKRTTIKKLTKAQKKEIKEYYKTNFGINVTTKYHELISSMCGVYKKEYMPFSVYGDLLESLSPYKFKKVIDDKVLYDWLLPDIRLPERVVSCCEGVIYAYSADRSKKEICEKELLEITANLNECIVKPSKDSSAGIGVKCITIVDGLLQGTNEAAKQLFDSYNGNYVIEKKIINNENLRRLNPSSCNTLRIHTWRDRSTAKIEFVSAFLRVGRQGSVVDNGFAGGIAIPVGKDGVLSNSGCFLKNYSRIESTDTGIVLKGYQIEKFEEIIAVAQKAHNNLPLFDFVGWDITVDANENIVVVEFNADPDMRLDQLIFLDTCLLDKQIPILRKVYEKKQNPLYDHQAGCLFLQKGT